MEILTTLGVDSKYLTGKHGPCLFCNGKDRWRFHRNDEYEINGAWLCNKCGHGDGFALLQRFKGWDFKTVVKEVNAILGNCTNAKQEQGLPVDKMFRIRQIYKESVPLEGTLAEKYLKTRCLLPDRAWLRDLRFNPNLYVPAAIHKTDAEKMVSAALVCVTRSSSMDASGIQATFLNQNAEKQFCIEDGKKMVWSRWNYGQISNGVWIGPREGADACVVSEGIETCLSAIQMAQKPGWACLGKGTFRNWNPETKCGPHKKVLIYGDNDRSYGGQAAAYQMSERLTGLGFTCEVHIPPNAGEDWNELELHNRYIMHERQGIKGLFHETL